MEHDNQTSIISQMLQDIENGTMDGESSFTLVEDTSPMTIDESAPGEVIELDGDFDFDGYAVYGIKDNTGSPVETISGESSEQEAAQSLEQV